MVSRSITEYLGTGLLSARPVTPDVVSGCSAGYFATDTGIFYVWDGTAWQSTGGSPPVSIVQSDSISLASSATGITLASAPTQGNLLLAAVHPAKTLAVAAGSGWTFLGTLGGTSNFINILAKIAGAGESATQTPTTSVEKGNTFMWEFADAQAPWLWPLVTSSSTTATVAFDVGATLPSLLASGILLGFTGRTGAAGALPTGIDAPYTLGMSESGSPGDMATQTFEIAVTAGSIPASFNVTYAGSTGTGRGWTIVI